MYDVAIEYTAKILEVKKNIEELQTFGIKCDKYFKMIDDIQDNTLAEVNENFNKFKDFEPFLKDSLNWAYANAIKELDNLKYQIILKIEMLSNLQQNNILNEQMLSNLEQEFIVNEQSNDKKSCESGYHSAWNNAKENKNAFFMYDGNIYDTENGIIYGSAEAMNFEK